MTASYYKPSKTYRVKITLDDQDANGLQLLEYQFTLTLADICSQNAISKTDLPKSTVYVIGSGPLPLNPVYSVLYTTAA